MSKIPVYIPKIPNATYKHTKGRIERFFKSINDSKFPSEVQPNERKVKVGNQEYLTQTYFKYGTIDKKYVPLKITQIDQTKIYFHEVDKYGNRTEGSSLFVQTWDKNKKKFAHTKELK
jgi:hypothetical protein